MPRASEAIFPCSPKNCATLQEELMRSELFGYCKGAFTGAEASREGLLSMAHEGTLFLDEIGDLSVGGPGLFVKGHGKPDLSSSGR